MGECRFDVDVAIVGAGPAGAMTALLLARRRPDLAIALWDARPTPTIRPCGEFLSPDGVRILGRAGLEAAMYAAGCRPLSGLRLAAQAGELSGDYRPWLAQTPPRDHGLGLRRERFDRVLQDAASAHCRLERDTTLHRLHRHDGGWRLQARRGGTARTLRARLVVGADGRHSLVRRLAGLDRPDRRPRFALMCRATGIPHGTRGEMHIGPLGQVGLAPIGDGEVNLNLLLAERSAGLLKRREPAVLMRAALRGTPSLRSRCAEATLGPVRCSGRLPQRSRDVVAPGLALVGDAAAFCDPFTGEGICFALQGAELLADHLARIPATGAVEHGVLRHYADAWRGRFGGRLRLGRLLQAVLRRRALTGHLVAGLGRFECTNRLFIAVTGDYARLLPRRRPRPRSAAA